MLKSMGMTENGCVYYTDKDFTAPRLQNLCNNILLVRRVQMVSFTIQPFAIFKSLHSTFNDTKNKYMAKLVITSNKFSLILS